MVTGFQKVIYRTVQLAFRCARPFLPYRVPELLSGEGSIRKLPEFIKSKGIN